MIKLPLIVSFDWDGTLADTRPCIIYVMDAVLAHYGLEPWEITKTKHIDYNKSLKDNFPNFFGADSEAAYQLYKKIHRENYRTLIKVLPGAVELLAALETAKVSFGIISSKGSEILKYEIAALFGQQSFTFVLGAEDAARTKPAPDPVLQVCATMGVEPSRENYWHVGDLKQDTDCALAAGVLPILINDSSKRPKPIDPENRIVFLPDLASLCAQVREFMITHADTHTRGSR